MGFGAFPAIFINFTAGWQPPHTAPQLPGSGPGPGQYKCGGDVAVCAVWWRYGATGGLCAMRQINETPRRVSLGLL